MPYPSALRTPTHRPIPRPGESELGQRYHCFGIHAPVSSLLIDSIDSLDPVSSLLIDSIDSLGPVSSLLIDSIDSLDPVSSLLTDSIDSLDPVSSQSPSTHIDSDLLSSVRILTTVSCTNTDYCLLYEY
jgi:hypothetical protein